MMTPTLTIDLDLRCSLCSGKGAEPNGLCLKCISRSINQRGAIMQVTAGIKKISTTTGENGVQAQVTIEFIVNDRTIDDLNSLVAMQDKMLTVEITKAQTELPLGSRK